jgi:hypothetical protein
MPGSFPSLLIFLINVFFFLLIALFGFLEFYPAYLAGWVL